MEEIVKEFSRLQVSDQIITFAVFVVLGGVLCLLYDLYRAVALQCRFKGLWVFLSDVFYFVFSAFVIFSVLLVECNGKIRIFALLGCTIGWTVCRFTISKWVRMAFAKAVQGIKFLCKFIKVKIWSPIAFLLKRVLGKVLHLKEIFTKYLKKSKKHLQKGDEVVYNQKNK